VGLCTILLTLSLFLLTGTAHSAAGGRGSGSALFLSETPPAGHEGSHGKGRGAGGEQGHAEHRAAASRTWYVHGDLSPDARAFILRPDGSLAEGTLEHGEHGWAFTVKTLPLDGSLDGIFGLYVVDRSVSGDELLIRVAKANMINHSCGWGHAFKFDQDRLRAPSYASIPLEITGTGLWDANFHSKTMSGDRPVWNVLSLGKAVQGASLSFRTASGWTRAVETDAAGAASVQLIRDYYPERWTDFDARKRGALLVTASRVFDEPGVHHGRRYTRVRMISTLPWRYLPARSEYTSYAHGLSLAGLAATATGIGVYAYRERRKRPYREVEPDA
jgi:hypothetical protein